MDLAEVPGSCGPGGEIAERLALAGTSSPRADRDRRRRESPLGQVYFFGAQGGKELSKRQRGVRKTSLGEFELTFGPSVIS